MLLEQNLSKQSWHRRHKILIIFAVIFVCIFAIISVGLYHLDPNKTRLNGEYAKGFRGIYHKYNCSNILGPSCQYDLMEEADKDTFVILPPTNTDDNQTEYTPYAKDKSHIYLDGKIVPDVDIESFVNLGYRYSYDLNGYYIEQLRATKHGFLDVERYLVQISKNQGSNSKPIIMDQLWLILADQVIFNGQIVPELDPATFKKIRPLYYEDKNYSIYKDYNQKLDITKKQGM